MAAGHARAPSIGAAPPPRGEADRPDTAFPRFSARLEALFERERAQLPLWLPVGLLSGIADETPAPAYGAIGAAAEAFADAGALTQELAGIETLPDADERGSDDDIEIAMATTGGSDR